MSELANQPLKLETLTMGNMSVEMVNINDDPWFYAPSLAKTLEYRDAANMLRGVPDDEKGTHSVSTLGGVQETVLLNEPGFYRVVMRSRSAVAEPFKRWVFHDILPSIRKTGQFKVHQEAQKLGLTLDYTDDQWEWLRYRPQFVDHLIPKTGEQVAGLIPRNGGIKKAKGRSIPSFSMFEALRMKLCCS